MRHPAMSIAATCMGTTALNLSILCAIYATIGWHFIRGYNEVINVLVVPAVAALAAINIIAGAAILLISGWRDRPASRLLVGTLFASACIAILSPVLAPVLGQTAKHKLWLHTPLVEAARYGDAPLVTRLVESGRDPNVTNVLGMTPLHYMVAGNQPDAVELLLEHGAASDPSDDGGMTPLHWAIRRHRNPAIVRLLLHYGAIPDAQDGDGKTPADYAASIPDPERSELLRILGASPPYEEN